MISIIKIVGAIAKLGIKFLEEKAKNDAINGALARAQLEAIGLQDEAIKKANDARDAVDTDVLPDNDSYRRD